MEITNLNFGTFLIFTSLIIFGIFFCFSKYVQYKTFNNIFTKVNIFGYIKYIFLSLTLIILSISILGIKKGNGSISINYEEGIDIVFVLDVSKSMNVADIYSDKYNYTRLDFSKQAITNFVTHNPNNKYSLVIFAGDAISTVPLTSDIDIFLSILENVDYRNLTIQGTDFEKSINLAINRLSTSEDNSNAIIFISDGGDFEDNINEDSFKKLKKENIEFFIAGVGTENGGKIITGRNHLGRLTYQTYNGEYVISKINEKNLKNISNSLEGTYLLLQKYSDINEFTKEISRIEKKVLENNMYEDKVDISRNLSKVAFVLFFIYLFLLLFDNKVYSLISKNE